MLIAIEQILPTFLAVLSLGLFTAKTRWFCYIAIALAISSELIPHERNFVGLATCITAFLALCIADLVRIHAEKIY